MIKVRINNDKIVESSLVNQSANINIFNEFIGSNLEIGIPVGEDISKSLAVSKDFIGTNNYEILDDNDEVLIAYYKFQFLNITANVNGDGVMQCSIHLARNIVEQQDYETEE